MTVKRLTIDDRTDEVQVWTDNGYWVGAGACLKNEDTDTVAERIIRRALER